MLDHEEDDGAPPSGTRRTTASTWDLAASGGASALGEWLPTERVSAWPWGPCALQVGEALVDPGDDGGTYRVVRLIGRGGMGEVYEVEREGTGVRFALKCMRMGRADDPKVVRRTQEEAIVLRSLRHPHLVPVHAMGLRSDGLVWMVMELLVGWTAGQLLDRLGKLPVPWALTIARDVCLGLQAVHPFAVHRDIKPDNIHVDEQGHVRVLDLGAGKFQRLGVITTGGFSIGTVAYMSPEQLMTPDAVDARSDLFSTGIVLYELLSGQHPFASRDDLVHKNKIGLAIAHDPPRPLLGAAPWVPAAVGEIVAQALEKDPADRQDNAEQLAVALDAALRRMEYEMGELPPLRLLGTRISLPDAFRRPPQGGEAAALGEAAAPGYGETAPLPGSRGRGHTERIPSLPPARAESTPPRGRGHTERMPSQAPRPADQAAPADEGATGPAADGRSAGDGRDRDRAWRPPPPAVRPTSRTPQLDTREIVAEYWSRHAETEPVPRAAIRAAREGAGENEAREAERDGDAREGGRKLPRIVAFFVDLVTGFIEAAPRWLVIGIALWWAVCIAYGVTMMVLERRLAGGDRPAEAAPAVAASAATAASAPAPAASAATAVSAPVPAETAASAPAPADSGASAPAPAAPAAQPSATGSNAAARPAGTAGTGAPPPQRRRPPARRLPPEIFE
ncbi:serine/threonine protein kinase [Sorangium sp. KYC3313]|uniref:serine/threonine protein kinase n=1 Tax=Sorangium sp. KYC3313 TaxID=3449740 RepID=UPI003F8ADDDD